MPQKVDPLSCSVYPFLDFLAGLFSEGVILCGVKEIPVLHLLISLIITI